MNAVIRENDKVYIPGVRRVSWETGEMCEFASCLLSALGCLGEQVAYPFVTGACGAAFCFTLFPGAWEFGSYGIQNMAEEPFEPVRRAMGAVGYAYRLHSKGAYADDAARILDSLARGVPVLAFQVVGPSDCVILTGYDAGGETLLGWSTYQDIPDDHPFPPDETGYFRKAAWHANLGGYVLLGEKTAPPSARDLYLDTLKWAVHLLRTPRMGSRVTGLAGLRGWAAEMTDEQYFPPGDEGTLGTRYLSAAINMTMLRDHCLAEPFLRQALADAPDLAPGLARAADCYAEVSRIRAGMDDLIGDNFSEKAMRAIADPRIRQAYAEAILQICAQEEQAAGWMEETISER